jgi:hypothetical protein
MLLAVKDLGFLVKIATLRILHSGIARNASAAGVTLVHRTILGPFS